MNSFRIIITLSHRSISFEYSLDGSSGALSPLGGESWPAPLAFFPAGNGIIIGDEAVNAYRSGRQNAFVDYFNDIKRDLRFTYGSEKPPLSQILLYATEERLRRFFKEEMFGRVGGLEENRGTMPLVIAFNDDIAEHERIHVITLFRASGYNNLCAVRYNKFVARYFARNIGYPRTLMAWSDGRDMHLALFNKDDHDHIESVSLPGLGVDPRIAKITELIWADVEPQLWYPKFENERERLEAEARAFLATDLPEKEGSVVMSDGTECTYYLHRDRINNLPQRESTRLLNELSHFLESRGYGDRSRTMLVLRGAAAGNDYFIKQFNHGFAHMIEVDDDLRRDVKQLLATGDLSWAAYPMVETIPTPQSNPAPAPSPAPARKSPSETPVPGPPASPTWAPPKIEWGIAPEKPKGDGSATPKERGIDEQTLNSLKHEWRQEKAAAKGKVRGGKADEAFFILNNFRDKCKSLEAFDLMKQVDSLIVELKESEAERPEPKPRRRPAAERHDNGGIIGSTLDAMASTAAALARINARDKVAATPQQPAPAPHPVPPARPRPLPDPAPRMPRPSADPAAEFIRTGNLQEARRIYRAQGNTYLAGLVKEIMRDQKSVQLRKNDLAACQASRNKAKARQICDELSEYIDKCDKIGFACQDIKKLLSLYMRI